MTEKSISLPKVLESLLCGKSLTSYEASELMKCWLQEQLTPVQTGAFLSALRAKGVSGIELSSMAKVLQEACALDFDLKEMFLVDTCGTGGDGADTFNISTAVAFVSGCCGVKVAKHGNRSASGKVGSADVLEGLGLNLKSPQKKVVYALEESNVTFLFAPAWHPALVNLAPLRKNLGIRTVFNLLGPLVNPLRPKAQVLGVAKPELLDPMADALNRLGLTRAVVVHGAGGLDEASLEGANEIRFLENGQITSASIEPKALGLSKFSNAEMKGGDLNLNQEILSSILKGEGTQSQLEIVAFNSALVLWASGLENDLISGVEKSLNCLSSGEPWLLFEKLRSFLQ